ncbi:MAG: VWA domain-containing protein [Candidatus Nitronauta litoralis]|uniref:VWA domain-containing protein n=1 Tax=Candidatus Nitronauta litoralis TaxID=2705533 RepID=A0A7T0BTK3_9BACT|nr:MAG: VWA domain-containing protein [Candidatus Nitronauta litoralis]
MSLNFLNPIYLFGLLGISLPVLIHLLTKRQQTRVRFSAVYLLTQAQKRSIRRSRPNRLLLLLLRCLALAFLCLALANPLFSMTDQSDLLPDQPTATVFILDDSYSMGALSQEGSLFKKALKVFDSFLEKMPDHHQVSLVLASDPPRVLQGWTGETDGLRKQVRSFNPSFQTTNIGGAFELAMDLLGNGPKGIKRVFLLTDLDENGWREESFPSMDEKNVQVRVLDFSESQSIPNHAAVESIRVSQEFLTHSRMIRVRYGIKNLSSTRALNSVNASLWVDGSKQSEETLSLKPGELLHKEFTFPHLGKDRLTGFIKLSDDGLLTDNKRIFSYQPDQRLRVLLVDGDPRGVSHQNEIFYIERAMNPFSRSVSDIEPQISTLAELPNLDLSRFSAVVLCNVRQIPFGYEEELERFVSQGGALMITLGDQVNPRAYNQKLGGLLPVSLKTINQINRNEKPFRVLAEASGHPALKIFSGKMLQELEHVRINTFFSLESKSGQPYIVPMRLTNEEPLLVESDYGKGKVLLYTTSIDRDWNNFPIQPMFLPWVQRWIKYTAQSLDAITRKDLRVMEAIEFGDNEDNWWVESPEGEAHYLLAENDLLPRFEETRKPGVYSLYTAPPTQKDFQEGEQVETTDKIPTSAIPAGGFTVNIDTQESVTEKIGETRIRDILRGLTVDITHQPESIKSTRVEAGFPLVTPLLLLAALALCTEGWMVRKE